MHHKPPTQFARLCIDMLPDGGMMQPSAAQITQAVVSIANTLQTLGYAMPMQLSMSHVGHGQGLASTIVRASKGAVVEAR